MWRSRLGKLMGKFRQFLIVFQHDNGGVLSFYVFIGSGVLNPCIHNMQMCFAHCWFWVGQEKICISASDQGFNCSTFNSIVVIRFKPFHGKRCVVDMCGQRMPRSDCASAQSDQGLRCPLTELLSSVEYNNVEAKPLSDYLVPLAHLNIHRSHMPTFHIARRAFTLTEKCLAGLYACAGWAAQNEFACNARIGPEDLFFSVLCD